jgi:hypothetical protein
MLKQTNIKERKELGVKMSEVFSSRIKTLPVEMQDILLDDLVTAFENRLSLFSQIQSTLLPVTVLYEKV